MLLTFSVASYFYILVNNSQNLLAGVWLCQGLVFPWLGGGVSEQGCFTYGKGIRIRNKCEPIIEKTAWVWNSRPPRSFSPIVCAADTVKSLQSCPTLCDPIDGSPLGSPIPGILQARILEWVAISFSNAWKWKVKVKSISHVRLLATPWTAAYQAPPSMGFSRQEYWRGVPLPFPRMSLLLLLSHFSHVWLGATP